MNFTVLMLKMSTNYLEWEGLQIIGSTRNSVNQTILQSHFQYLFYFFNAQKDQKTEHLDVLGPDTDLPESSL